LSIAEEEYFEKKIDLLRPTVFLEDQTIKFEHSLQLTMIDGKICSALSETSSAKCYICEATPTQMSNLDVCLQKDVHEDRYTQKKIRSKRSKIKTKRCQKVREPVC